MKCIYDIIQIKTSQELDSIIPLIKETDQIPLDLEMNNTHFFHPIICLIQILIKDTCYLIDPLSIDNLTPLLDLLQEKNYILHGSDYDLRCLYQNYNFLPTDLFDTMVAAQFLDLKPLSLDGLVQKKFKVSLDKKYQRANWYKRPLSSGMIEYAAQDTFYLAKLKIKLYKTLKRKKKLLWYEEFFQYYLKTLQQKLDNPTNQDTWKIKGSRNFNSKQLQVLKYLWHWREKLCQEKNIPRNFCLTNQQLFDIVHLIPKEIDSPCLWNTIFLKCKNKPEVKTIIEEALQEDPLLWPKNLKTNKQKQPSFSPQIISELKMIRDKIAKKYKVSVDVLPKKYILEKISQNPKQFLECKSLQELDINILTWQEKILTKPWKKHLKKWCKKNNVIL